MYFHFSTFNFPNINTLLLKLESLKCIENIEGKLRSILLKGQILLDISFHRGISNSLLPTLLCSNELIDFGSGVEHAALNTKPEPESNDNLDNGDSKCYKKVAAWIGKTCRKIKLQPYINESLLFRAVVVCPGTFNLNIFELSVIGNDTDAINIKSTNDESVIRVFDSQRKSCRMQ